MRLVHLFLTAASLYSAVHSSSINNGSYSEGSNVMMHNNTTIEYIPLNADDHSCKRPCQKNEGPMECRYNFVVEWYRTLSNACYSCPEIIEDCFRPDCIFGDGTSRTVLVINRTLPGPTIEVCLGDRVIVDVENLLMGDTTTIHWHGHHQRGTPYMDGVPFVTQYPIQPGTTFTYDFTATNPGTHFWHSHTGIQRGDGAFGPFIVHVPDELNAHHKLYDFDLSSHIMSLLDWDKDVGLNIFVNHHHSIGDNKPATLLVNGMGWRLFDNDLENTKMDTPIARFVVKYDYRYRFRLINAGFLNCPIEMSVDNHTITVISSDGNDFKAVEAASLVTYAGERFDFIINANQSAGIYWIRFRGLLDCDERYTRAHQVAILQYEGTKPHGLPKEPVPTYEDSHVEGLQVNPFNKGTGNINTLAMPELHALEKWDTSMKENPDEKFYIYYDFYKISNPHFYKFPLYGFHNMSNPKNQKLTPQLNRISLKLPGYPLLLAKDYLNGSTFCNSTTLEQKKINCTTEFCQCTHVLSVKLNSIVEVILIDNGFAYDANHPFHLHGHSFRVVGMDRIGNNVTVEKIKELDKEGLLKRNLFDAPVKDTVTVPDGGYTIIRFNASNPGYWMFHCHLDFHVEIGMALIFKFGEASDMPPPPSFTQLEYMVQKPSSSANLRNSLIVLLVLLGHAVTF